MKKITLSSLRKKDPKMHEFYLYSKNKTGITFEQFKKEFMSHRKKKTKKKKK